MLTELRQPWPMVTSRGKALAYAIIDYGSESPLLFVCALKDSGEIWCVPQQDAQMEHNWSMGITNHAESASLRALLLRAFCEERHESLAWEDFIQSEVNRLGLNQRDTSDDTNSQTTR